MPLTQEQRQAMYASIDKENELKANQNTSYGGDLVDAFQMGALNAAGGVANFINEDFAEKNFFEPAREQVLEMTDESQRAMQADSLADMGARGVGLHLSSGVGQMATTLPLGLGAGKAISTIGRLKAGTTATQMGGLGLSGGASAQGQTAHGVKEQVLNTDFETLANSPVYKELFLSIDNSPEFANASDAIKLDLARKQLADKASYEAEIDPAMWAANIGLSAIGDSSVLGVLGKTTRGARSVLPNAAKGFAVEGSTESLQGGTEHYRSNAILRDNADPSINPSDGLGNTMLTEGVIGGLTGGAIKGTYGTLTGELHKPKASEGDQIDLTNPNVGNEDQTLDDESVNRAPSSNAVTLSEEQIQRVNQTTAPNYDVPAYARQNGVESQNQFGAMGDDLINNNIRPSNVPAVIPKQTNLQTIPGETATGYDVAPYQYEGELIQQEPMRSSSPDGLLGKGQIIDDAEYYEQRGLPDKHTGVIYGQDNRPMQQAQENADKLKRAPLALTDKNVIFTADERKWRGMSSGHPFRSERALKLSAPYKAAVKSGAQIDIQKTKGGYVWSAIENTRLQDDSVSESIGAGQDNYGVGNDGALFVDGERERTARSNDIPEGNEVSSREGILGGNRSPSDDSAIEDSKIAVNDTVSNVDVIQTPVNELSLSSDIPQFKSGSDSDGVVEPLTGKFDPVGMSPIQVWVRKDGRKEIITGRHRFDLAKRSGISNIPAQYHFESKGFTADDGKRLDAILNIREDKGQVEDYVELFKQDGITESEAKQYGLLDRATGRTAYKIANSAVNETIEAQRSGRISSQAAEAIADAAPNNEKLQVLGIKAIADDQRSIAFAKNLIHAVSAISKTNSQKADNGDLFGFDDSAMREAEDMAKVAAKKQRELRTRLNSIRGAAKNPKLAKEEGVDVKDPQSLIKRTQALSDEAKAWDSWHTNPNLVSQIKSEINEIEQPNPQELRAVTDGSITEGDAQTNSFFENENQSGLFGNDEIEQSTETVDKPVDKPLKANNIKGSAAAPDPKPSKLDTAEQKLNDELSDLFGELKAAFKEQKGTFNSGIDPKIAFIVSKIGAVLAAKGVVKFAQWANKLVKLAMQNGIPKDDIKPYLKSSYGAIANDPDRYGVSDDVADSMDSPREVRAADVDAILEENAKPEQEPQSDSRTVDETKRSDVIGGNEATDRKITSLSYERSKKRTEKNVEGFISGNGQGGYIKEPLTYKKTPYSTHERLLENKLTKDEFEAAIVEIKEDKDVILDKIKLELKGGGALAIAYRDFVNDSSWGRKTNSQKAAIAYSKMVSDIERITQQSDTTPVKQPSNTSQAKPIPKPNLATKFKAGDLSSVKQSLPMLTDKQADDMVKIENRFNGLNGVKKGRGFLLTNGTGTGKTFNGLAAIARAKQQGKKNILILSLSDGISNQWIKTGKDHFDLDIYKIGDESPTNRGDRGKEITIASYVTFGDSKPLVTERDWDLIIADESQTLMQGAQAIPSKALKSLRSVIGHSEFNHKAYLFFADEQAKINDLYQSLNKTYLSAGLSVEDASAKAQSETQTEQDKLNTKIREKAEQFKKEAKAKPNDNTNVLMLSASPFAYVKNLDYAEGLLFNYSDYGPEFEGGYENAGHGHNAFYIENFGYRWRNHRLTTPSGKVNSGLMERNFYENMKKQGVLSGRFIEIDNDFGRNFYIVESAAGKKLDDAISIINDSKNDKDESLYPNLSTALRNLFDFTEQVKFTEAIKAPETVKVAKKMIEQGKKVIIFHSYNVGGSSNPLSRLYSNSNPEVQNELSILERANRGILDINFGGLERPLDVFQDAFGDSVVFYNGKVPAKQRIANKDAFNEKGGKVKVIVVQQDAGSAGLSLHDVHGDEPRVLINMGLPFKPVQSIQIEGRPVRVGVKSDTAIVYMTTGTRFEEYAFASKIATRADTADNLALGDEARGIKDSFVDGYSELIDNPDAIQFDGAKAMAERQKLSPFDKAKAYYYGVLKNNKRRDQREGVDYFATPEPLGLKMVEWLQAAPGDRLLEPSGGHGAIARFFPSDTINKAIEDSPNLINKLQLVFNGNAKKGDFLKMPLINKFEGIVMNPPYGVGGKTAMEHLSKAVKHLAFGGRIVALIPHGGNASKNFDKFLDEHEKQIQLTKSITMPRSTFENAGTSVSSKVVVLDKLEKGHDVIQHEETNLRDDYSIDEFFNRIENMDLPDRDRPEKPEVDFKRYSVVRNKKFSTEVSIKKSFHDFASENREGIMDIAREYDGFNEERSDGYTFSFKNEDSAEDFANEIAAMINDSGIKYRDLMPDVASVPNGTFKASRENPDLVGYTMDSKHTKTDDDLFVVNFEGDMGDEYSDINSIAKDNGGYYIKAALRRFYTPKDGGEKQGTPTYTFKSKDDRDAFISALSMRSADAESLAFNKAKDAPPKGISHRAAKLALHKFMKEYQGAGNTKVVIADKDQADVLGAEYSIDKIGYVKGAYGRDTDTLYIFPQNHRSMDDLRATLQEEILVHKGILGLPPIHQQALLLAIMDTRKSPKKSIKEAWARIDRLYGHESEVDKAEEFLAKISHDKMNLLDRYYQKLLSAVHKIMVKLGLTRAEMSRADMRLMVYKMSESLKTKRENNNSKPNGKSLKFNLAESAEPARSGMDKLGLGETDISSILDKLKPSSIKSHLTKDNFTKFKERATEGVFDSLYGIKKAEDSLNISPEKSGYISARLSTGVSDVLHGVMFFGAPQWKDGVVARKDNTKGLLEVLGKLDETQLNNWLAWMGGNRADKLMQEGRENNLNQDEIDALKALNKGNEALFDEIKAEYNKINSATLDLAQEAGLVDSDARSNFDEEWYVPFFREQEEGELDVDSVLSGPMSKKGIANQTGNLRKLKGGKQATKDILSNIMQRQATLIEASMKNKAMVEVAENLSGSSFMQEASLNMFEKQAERKARQYGKSEYVEIRVNGKDKWYKVQDASLMRALTQLTMKRDDNPLMKISRAAKRLLTTGVTLSPDFILRNFIRDSVHGWMINKDGFKFGKDSYIGAKQTWANDEATLDLMFAGASFQGGYVHANDPEKAAQQIRRALRKKGLSKSEIDKYIGSIAKSTGELFEKYRSVADAMENANRASTYSRAKEAGKSAKVAAFEAKDFMDFSLQGNFKMMQFFIDVLPFFNARMQGLYKLYRSSKAQGNDQLLKVFSKELLIKGSKVAAFSLGLALLNSDDERYEDLQDWDKDANWHFFLGDTHIRVPKPFELGVVFGTVPERMFNFASGNQTADDLRKSLMHGITETLAMNPIPQVIKPGLESYMNHSFFFDGPIEGMGDQFKRPEDRYSIYTSETAKALGEAFGFSPKKIEHLTQGYLGTLGMYLLGAADLLSNSAAAVTGNGEFKVNELDDLALIRKFVKHDEVSSGYYSKQFYDMMGDISGAYNAYKDAIAEQDQDTVKELLEDSKAPLQFRKIANRAMYKINQLNRQRNIIGKHSNYSQDKKDQLLDDIERKKNAIFKRIILEYRALNE